ncbi:hypothetical protein WJX84_007833 [Apatococcus fuscideae]|uniref:Protein TIC 20 n=1 Tax=Apatococcus fuscideae TaxID=2026836 RepID=A0AAW1T3Q7_9CHLO
MLAGCLHNPVICHSRQSGQAQAFKAPRGALRPSRHSPGRKQPQHAPFNPAVEWTSCHIRCRVASLPYLVPLFDGLKYGKFVFMQYPIFMKILGPLDPLVRLYFGFPFASLIVFFAIYSGIVNNQSFSRYVRYNGMQSILLDILLILPSLLERVFKIPMGGPGLQIYIQAYNTIFLFVFICVAYGIGSCLLGKTPRLPLISDAANQQVR